jgi:serine/threonine protein kinase
MVLAELPKDNLDVAAAEVKRHPNFDFLRQLGVGSYASVWLARDRRNSGREVAVKVFLHGPPKYFEEDSQYEVTIMRKLPRHQNIVRLLDVYSLAASSFIVYEALEMDLRQHLKRRGAFEGSHLPGAALQILAALSFCHRLHIIHCDLTPKNILVDQGGLTLKVADFGTSEICTKSAHPHTREFVTLWYRAPELLLGVHAFTNAIDIWSFGCVLAEMACARTLFPGDSQVDMLFLIFRLLGTPTEKSWPGSGKLPHFNPSLPKWLEGRFTQHGCGIYLAGALGDAGLTVLFSALERCPARRFSAHRLQAQKFFAPSEPESATSSRWLDLIPTPSSRSRRAAAPNATQNAEALAPKSAQAPCESNAQCPVAAPLRAETKGTRGAYKSKTPASSVSAARTRAPLRHSGCLESVMSLFERIRLVPSASAPSSF